MSKRLIAVFLRRVRRSRNNPLDPNSPWEFQVAIEREVDVEGDEAAVISSLKPPHRGESLPIGQLLLEVHGWLIPGHQRGPARRRLFDRLQLYDFHVAHKEVNIIHTTSCEFLWTRVAMRCVRISADEPRLVPVSFPWARLLPQSCDDL